MVTSSERSCLDVKSNLGALAYNSQLLQASTLLILNSGHTQNAGSIGYLMEFSEFCVPSNCSDSGFRLENEQSPMGLTKDLSRRPISSRSTASWKPERSSKYPIDLTFSVVFESGITNVPAPSNRKLEPKCRTLPRTSEVRAELIKPTQNPGSTQTQDTDN